MTFNGIQLWIDTSLFKLSEGSPIISWLTPSNAPMYSVTTNGSYKSNLINGKGAIQLLPGQTINVPNVTLSGNMSLFVVFYPNSQASTGPSIQLGSNPDASSGFYLQTAAPQFCINTGSPLYANTNNSVLINNNVQMLECVSNENVMTVYVNGTSKTSTAISTPLPTQTAQTLIINGRQSNVSSNYLAEVIMFNIPLSTQQRFFVEGYLAWKWGLCSSLPTSHPYYLYQPLTLFA